MNVYLRSFVTLAVVMAVAAMGFSELNAQCGTCEYLSGNLVVNGDFQQGNTGFTTDYTLATVSGPWGLLSYGGTYVIGSNANTYHSFFQGFDHTNPPLGNYMIVNGSSTPNTNVWCQTINVEPDTWYSFSAWARNVDTNPNNNINAQLQFNIDGVPLGPSQNVSGGWIEFSEEWFSGNATSIEICLVNQQTNGGGNDFGIDDITFTTCMPYIVENVISAGDDLTICSGETVTLGEPSITGFTYNWNDLSLSDTGIANPSVTLYNETDTPISFTYAVEADTAALGCIQTDQVTVIVNPLPALSLISPLVLCEGDEQILDAGGGWEAVEWSTGEENQQIIVSQPGNYTATVTLLDCQSSASIVVETPALPAIELGPNTAICEDEELVLNAGAVGQWSTGVSAEEITVNQEAWYWMEVSNQGCSHRDSMYLTIIEYPIVELPELLELCPGEESVLSLSQPGAWSSGVYTDSLEITQEGVYSVVVANEQCAVTGETEVVALSLPFVALGDDQTLCIRDKVLLDAQGAANDSILWSDGSVDYLREITETGTYSVMVWNQCATAEDEINLIFDDCDHALYIPNAFTPDGDGLNENWCITGLNIIEFELHLFNRWGEEVWSMTSLDDCWDGSHQHGDYYVPNGVYSYMVKAITHKGYTVVDKGSVVILR